MDELMPYYDIINQQQQQNNAWSAEQAQKAMDFQERMSNTAHRREVADLKAAGLNPVLSAGGQGASTTSGVAAQAGHENVTALYGLVSKALEASLAQAEAAKVNAQTVAGATGSSNPVFADNIKDTVDVPAVLASAKDYDSKVKALQDAGIYDPWEIDRLIKEEGKIKWSDLPVVNGFENILYRLFGIKEANIDEFIDKVQNFKPRYDQFLEKIASSLSGSNVNALDFLNPENIISNASAKALKSISDKLKDLFDNSKTNFNAVASTGRTGANGNRRMVVK